MEDAPRSLWLAGLSQLYSAAAPSYLLMRLAMLFESQPNHVGQATMLALQVLSLLYMAAVFAAGFFRQRAREKSPADSAA